MSNVTKAIAELDGYRERFEAIGNDFSPAADLHRATLAELMVAKGIELLVALHRVRELTDCQVQDRKPGRVVDR